MPSSSGACFTSASHFPCTPEEFCFPQLKVGRRREECREQVVLQHLLLWKSCHRAPGISAWIKATDPGLAQEGWTALSRNCCIPLGTESHRMVEVGKNLQRSSNPTINPAPPCSPQNHPTHAGVCFLSCKSLTKLLSLSPCSHTTLLHLSPSHTGPCAQGCVPEVSFPLFPRTLKRENFQRAFF